MNNPFLEDISRRTAEVTPEQMAEFSALLKPVDPHFKELGVLDLELQKLWVVIQLLYKEGTDHEKSIFRVEPRNDEEAKVFLQGVKDNLTKIKKLEAFEAHLSFVVSATYGWNINEIEVGVDWKVFDRKPVCEDCGEQHRLGGFNLGGLGGMSVSILEVDLGAPMDEDRGPGHRRRGKRSFLDRILGRS